MKTMKVSKNSILTGAVDEPPKGYKRTKIGILPEEWQIKRLKEIADINPRKKRINENELVSFIAMSDVSEAAKVINSSNRLFKEVEKGFTAFVDSDILVAKITPCFENGKGALVNKLTNGIGFGSTEFHVIRTNLFCDKEFVFLHTLSERFRKTGEINMTGTAGQKRIPTDFIRNYLIGYPEDSLERSKIAEILLAWDKAIDLKERLIKEKKKKKRGLLQGLLTGKFRLHGYDDEWMEISLGSILKERRETGYNDLELLAITMKNGVVSRSEIEIKDNSSTDKSNYKRICPLDIGYNTMRMWQGVSGVSQYEGIVSPAYTVLQPTEKVDSYFIGYLFKLPEVINLFFRYSQGLTSDTLNLKYQNLKGIKVHIPSNLKEQKDIANILQLMDKSIEISEQELEALKNQKKGLMQRLLTGILRVNVSEN